MPVAKEVFDRLMPTPNQIHRLRQDVKVSAADLLTIPSGTITEAGLRLNLDVGIQYLTAWLEGNGCVPIYNLMEDAATAEISRSQVWQWVYHRAKMSDGRCVTPELVQDLLPEVVAQVKQNTETNGHTDAAADLFRHMILNPQYTEFLTLPAYEQLD